MFDLVIHGRVLETGTLRDAYVCIEGGIISELRRSRPGNGELGEIRSFGKKLLLPGVIDSHVHMRDPGSTHKENLYTGSVSAAFGGVTTFIDMPNTIPPTIDRTTFIDKYTRASSESVIDFGLNLGIMSSSGTEHIGEILGSGTRGGRPTALKAFMGESTGSLIYGPYEDLGRWVDMMALYDVPLCVHAEDGGLFRSKGSGGKSILMAHDEMRPPNAETSAIKKVLRNFHVRRQGLHFLHVSSEEGLRSAEGQGCTIEVTPHHLLLDIQNAEKHMEVPALAKVNPPLRKRSDRKSLWHALGRSTIYTIGSDHAPHTLKEKTDADHPPSGIPGTETMLPLMLQKVVEKKIELHRITELLSGNPAKRFGLQDRGSLLPGMKADMIVVDPDRSRTIRAEDLHSKCGWTVYEGMKGIFPERVYSRGELIVEDENLCVKRGRGVPIKP
ncbi:MAG: dihydroorotase [Thermoplasmatota archaeon]